MNTIKYKHAKTGKLATVTVTQDKKIIDRGTHTVDDNGMIHRFPPFDTKASANKRMLKAGYIRA